MGMVKLADNYLNVELTVENDEKSIGKAILV